MVAIKGRDAERFVDAPPAPIFLFLVFGPDAGLVRERALRLVARRVDDRHDPFSFVEMSGEAVAADPLALLDEANTVPLFGGRRAILVETGAKSIASAVETLIGAPPAECSVILTAGALKRDAPLRKLVEGAKGAAAIECLPDSEQDLRVLIDKTLREAGLTAAPEALALLQAALGEDRLMSRAELAKLALYMHGRELVKVGDVEDIVVHAATAATDRVMLAAFSGDMGAAGASFDQIMAQGGDATQLVAAALRYALALHRGKLAAEREGRAEAGVSILKRAGFFAAGDAMLLGHLRNWTATRLATLIEPLRAAQTRARAHAEVAKMEASRALMRVAQTATKR